MKTWTQQVSEQSAETLAGWLIDCRNSAMESRNRAEREGDAWWRKQYELSASINEARVAYLSEILAGGAS
jgi:hypothetical protein